jgi:hypothetical protein
LHNSFDPCLASSKQQQFKIRINVPLQVPQKIKQSHNLEWFGVQSIVGDTSLENLHFTKLN